MIDQLLETLLTKMKNIVETETVIGKPIETADTTVIPVTKISLGFGVGGGKSPEGGDNKGSGSGTGGGAVIEPIAVITIHEGEVKVNSLKKEQVNLARVVDLVPDVLEKFTRRKGPKKAAKKSKKEEK